MILRKQNNRPNGRPKNKYNVQNLHRNRNLYKQNLERYLNLARDAATNGDEILAEGYRQHAEFFLRQVNEVEHLENNKGTYPSQKRHLREMTSRTTSPSESLPPPSDPVEVEIPLPPMESLEQ